MGIAANGQEAHVVQRVFWAITEGAVAIALLQAGGPQSLKALQAVSIIAGLPFTVILMFMCTALWRALKIDQGDMAPKDSRTDWSLPLYGGIFDMLEVPLSMGRSGMPRVTAIQDFCIGLVAPPLLLWRAMRGLAAKQGQSKAASSTTQDVMMVVICTLLYLAFWLFHILTWADVNHGMNGLGWAALVFFAGVVGVVRNSVRTVYHIEGSGIEDFFASLFIWPQVLAQLAEQVTEVSFSSFLSSAAFLASSSSFFLACSTSLKAFHFFAKASASALSSVTITLSNIVPALTCHKSKPRKPKSA